MTLEGWNFFVNKSSNWYLWGFLFKQRFNIYFKCLQLICWPTVESSYPRQLPPGDRRGLRQVACLQGGSWKRWVTEGFGLYLGKTTKRYQVRFLNKKAWVERLESLFCENSCMLCVQRHSSDSRTSLVTKHETKTDRVYPSLPLGKPVCK